jgi:hypothetical protein
MKLPRTLACVLTLCVFATACREDKSARKEVKPLAPMPKESQEAPAAPPPPADLDAAVAGIPQEEAPPEVKFIVLGAPMAAGGEGSAGGATAVPPAGTAGDLVRLSRALRTFVETEKHVPKSLEELVAAGTIASLPAPPAGRKFVIDDVALDVKLK